MRQLKEAQSGPYFFAVGVFKLWRSKSDVRQNAQAFWTPQAPRRDDERSEESILPGAPESTSENLVR